VHIKITSVFDPNLRPTSFTNGFHEKRIIFSRVKSFFPHLRFSYLGIIVFVTHFYIDLIKAFTDEEFFLFVRFELCKYDHDLRRMGSQVQIILQKGQQNY